jgi:hypothetical protein
MMLGATGLACHTPLTRLISMGAVWGQLLSGSAITRLGFQPLCWSRIRLCWPGCCSHTVELNLSLAHPPCGCMLIRGSGTAGFKPGFCPRGRHMISHCGRLVFCYVSVWRRIMLICMFCYVGIVHRDLLSASVRYTVSVLKAWLTMGATCVCVCETC